jgi:hypothetical protein
VRFTGHNAHRARAIYCSNQSDLAKDAILKKFWEDLANEWLALDNKSSEEKDQPEH